MRRAIDRERLEQLGVEAVGDLHAALGVDAEQALGAMDLVVGEHDQAPAALGPAPHPRLPFLAVGPFRVPQLDRLEHQQLGAVQVADDRDVGRDPRGRLVQGREVVEVQDVGLGRARVRERARPRVDLALVGGLVEAGEDRVRRALAVLVGRVEGRIEGQRVGRRERGRKVDGVDVEPAVEDARVAGPAGQRQRAGEDRRPPAGAGQRCGEVLGHMRRTPAREEQEPHEDPAAFGGCGGQALNL